MDENVFEVHSPLGHTVICSCMTWNNHILMGHPNMRGREEEVKNAIEMPDSIFASEERPADRDVYFKGTLQNNMYTKVVTQKRGIVHYVVSAWRQKEVKGNIGVMKYVKPKL